MVFANISEGAKKQATYSSIEPIGGNPGSRKKLNVRGQLVLFFWRVPKIAPGPVADAIAR